ncbi:putative polysaccharide biosynthesis protein [Jeotgalibacillus marinus]|uniref:Polysaccharide biosynthesis protein n=1 Tax=Jeotgalibacillus marinus TaxID=86667 RepID=A0ABV3Q5T9_9BACL
MKNKFIMSTLILSMAALVSKILGSMFRIPLQNIAGDEVLGIFTLVYPVYMVALTLSVAGIPISISKLIAEARAKEDPEQIRNIFLTSGILATLFGVSFFILLYSFSGQVAEVLGGPSTRLALVVVSCTLLIAPYMAVYRGFFQGYGIMTPTAISQVIEQFVRVGIILVIAFYMVNHLYSNEDVAGGIMIGSSLGAVASLVYLRILYMRSNIRVKAASSFNAQQFANTSKLILRISIPISIGAITMALLNLVDSISIPTSLKSFGNTQDDINYLYGIYGRGLTLVQIVTVFATSIVLPLVPSISAKLTQNDHKGTIKLIENTYFLTDVISWPAAIGLVALTYPINFALFTNLEGSNVLAIISFSSLFTSLTVLGTGILQGMNKAKLAAWIIIGGVLSKLFLNIILVNVYGLIGAAISTAIVYLLLFIINTYFIWKHSKFNYFSKKIATVLVSSMIMGVLIGFPSLVVNVEELSRTVALIYVGALIIGGVIIYFSLLLLCKVIDKDIVKRIPFINLLSK